MRHTLGPIGPILRGGLGPRAMLWELACIVANPGAPHQGMHRDVGVVEQPAPGLYNVFVALQDVTCAMGPTVLVPRTHSNAAIAADTWLHEADRKAREAGERARRAYSRSEAGVADEDAHADATSLLDAERAVKAFLQSNRAPLLAKGDALIYDTRLRHCGAANVSAQPRRMLTFAFAAEGAAEAGHLRGATADIVAELSGACSLDDDPSEWPPRPDCLVKRDTYFCRS